MSGSPRLLIVEDEPLMAMVLADLVQDLGYDPLGPIDGEHEAVTQSRRQNPDVILMDIRLARGGNGLAAAREIRRDSDTPIVFCTSEIMHQALRDEIADIGRTRVIEKHRAMQSLGPVLAEAMAL